MIAEALRTEQLEAESAPKGEIEQQERLRQSLELVQLFTRQAGHELPISAVRTADEIPDIPGVYVLSEGQEDPIRDTNFVLSPNLLSGTRDSGHAVVSGNMTIERRKNSQPQEIQVAVKCFMKRDPEERLQRARQEVRIMQQLAEEGELTFVPRCVVIGNPNDGGRSCVAIMTEFDPSILSLDNHPWSAQTPENLSLALNATYALGRFNAGEPKQDGEIESRRPGRYHGDAKIKNIAQDDLGMFGMIDFETSLEISAEDPVQASWCAISDLHKLLDSLKDRGFFPQEEHRREVIVGTLVEAYLDAWIGSPEDVQSAVLTACADVQSAFHEMHAQKQTYSLV